MYLKSIFIQGFKSFPDKTTINFNDGLTAIVGPNGSGKSNICDAVRWVFGEQSTKMLRGSRMEDVIFNGTQNRPAVGFAEVALTIDNSSHFLPSEYDEVTIGRRYYRSGESEYYINKKPVRLKDVNEMFMDTGLGRDGYSIIGQGRIADLLSARSEDRRGVFEEAAGISKYRYKKLEAERRLTATDDNLARVGDIINELHERIGPLGEQSKKARQYLALRDERRDLEINMWLNDLDRLHANLSKYQQDYAVSENTLMLNRRDADSTDAEIEELRERIREKDVENERLRTRAHENENEITRLEGECELIKSNIDNNTGAARGLEERSHDSEADAQGLRGRLEACAAEEEKLKVRLSDMESSLAELLEHGRAEEKSAEGEQSRLDEISAAMAEVTAKIADARIGSSVAQTQADALTERIAALEAEISVRDAEHNEAKEQLETAKKELGDADEEIKSVENMSLGYRKKLESRTMNLTRAQERYDGLERELAAKTQRIDMLRELERSYEGFNRSVKTVMQQAERGRLNNIFGPVSKLIKTESEHSVAIEIALGGAMQNIVVGSADDAKAAIGMLKDQNAGRATFLPVDTIRPNELKERGLEKNAGFIGVASSLVKCGERYRDIVSNLLGRTVITDTIDSAIAMSRKYDRRFRIVSLDGQSVNVGGSMTGGSFNRSAGIFSRANEIETLTKEAAQAQDRIRELSAELSSCRSAVGEIESLLSGCENDRRELGEKRAEQAARTEGLQRSLNTIAAVREALAGELEASKSAVLRAGEQKSRIDRSIDELNAAMSELVARSEEIEGSRDAAIARRDAVAESITERKIAINSAEKDIEAQRSAMAELNDRISSLSQERSSLLEQARALIEKNGELEAEMEQKRLRVRELGRSCEKLKGEIEANIRQKTEFEAMTSARQREFKEQQNRLLELEKEHTRLENRISSAKTEEEGILSRMWDEYELTAGAAQRYRRDDIGSASAVARRVGQIKNEIKALGNINIDAIEEYEKVNERYTFLTAQRDDLLSSKEHLNAIIAEMSGLMRTIFKEKFAVINDSFSKTFNQLFGGGTASVELTDPADVLQSGIEIKVQPPGKKLRSMSLLSGGEQSFVAIALLLAIMQVRPTPFCIFDEVESALDDINVLRFAEYLRQYVDRTQFILITHRRGTMENADMLYGVTMQEHGVSKLLAINVADVEKKLKLKV